MTLTILAVAFLFLIVVVGFGGTRVLGSRALKNEEMNLEKCSICRQKFDKIELVLREIGDYKLLYFCKGCIVKLYSDLGAKN